jgi:hypothetical protein
MSTKSNNVLELIAYYGEEVYLNKETDGIPHSTVQA